VDDLSHLFSAHFYEAWDEFEYESWEEAVDDYARCSPERVPGAVAALQQLLADNLPDAQLDRRLRAAGCTYLPDVSDRAWLVQLLGRLRDVHASIELAALKHLMSAYFHQDWFDEYEGSWRMAVEDFARRSPERVPALSREIDSVLHGRPTDRQVARLLDELGNFRDPGDEPQAHLGWLESIRSMLAPSHGLVRRLVAAFPPLDSVLQEHLSDQEGELLPYLVMADIARWTQATNATDPELAGEIVDWLEREFATAEPAEKDLIGLGFVETIPYPPEGAALLLRLGPELTSVARDLGLVS
jgi:hypothetical protein